MSRRRTNWGEDHEDESWRSSLDIHKAYWSHDTRNCTRRLGFPIDHLRAVARCSSSWDSCGSVATQCRLPAITRMDLPSSARRSLCPHMMDPQTLTWLWWEHRDWRRSLNLSGYRTSWEPIRCRSFDILFICSFNWDLYFISRTEYTTLESIFRMSSITQWWTTVFFLTLLVWTPPSPTWSGPPPSPTWPGHRLQRYNLAVRHSCDLVFPCLYWN